MRTRSALAGAVVAILILAGCGGDDDDSTSEERPEDVEESAAATATPLTTNTAPTPTAIPAVIEPERLTYTVEPGDTMGAIANTFGVPLGALIEVNDMEDADVIQVGQEIIIPTDEEVEEWEAAQAAQTGTEADAGADSEAGTDS